MGHSGERIWALGEPFRKTAVLWDCIKFESRLSVP